MKNRFAEADAIWNGGASNPRAVARALVEAIDQACDESRGVNDPAVYMILDHLCFLVGMPQPALDMSPEEWIRIMEEVEKRK